MNGILCVNKSKDYTSFDVVAIMRRLTGVKRIGHGGTLDPMAEGVLPVFIGNATKAVDYCPDDRKEYYAGFRLGLTTDTQDITGTILTENNTYVSRNKIIAAERFKGEQMQIPPMYSAVQINGVRMYDLARQGIEVERQPRRINIHEIKVEDYKDNEGYIRVLCSKGTYIRTLIHDIGQMFEVGAVMTSLVRTRSCGFTLDNSYKLSELEKMSKEEIEALLIPVENLYGTYPAARLDETQTKLFGNGAMLDAGRVSLEGMGDVYSVYNSDGKFLAIAMITEDNSLQVIQRFKC